MDKIIQRWTVQVTPEDRRVVEVEVDFRRIASQLGPRACRSRGGKSRFMSGAVVVRAVEGAKS